MHKLIRVAHQCVWYWHRVYWGLPFNVRISRSLNTLSCTCWKTISCPSMISDALQINNLFSRWCSVCYAFEPTLVVIMYPGYEHIGGSIHKQVDSVPHSVVFQKDSLTFKAPSCRASGNGAPLISGCLVSCICPNYGCAQCGPFQQTRDYVNNNINR